ncbi:MAG: FAD-dependent oxidoreductase, partial [Clostridia bacterium]|nr:FAD-dependent oxidoreductase [Clostridia bacterium]
MYDVLIIGAGIEGTAIARRLSRYQLKIALLDKDNDVSMGATKANSAIVHGGYAEANAKLKGRVCYQGRRQYAQLDKELG